jgi:hypothetical protein
VKFRTWLPALFLLLFVHTVHGQVYRLSGTVTDADDGTQLKNATIQIRSIKKSVISSDSGTFQFLLPIGNYTVLTSFVGYNQKGLTVNLQKDESIHIVLKKKASTELDEVIVNAQVGNNRLNETQMGIIRINPEQLKRIPVAFGEPDILKALVLQPGVSTIGEGAGGFSVRGGNADQNLVLLDGAPLFNTSHLLGFYTAISPDVAQDITLHKGSIPANYGGRIASLLNIRVKPGNTNATRLSGGVSPVSARLFADGATDDGTLRFTAGARVAFPNLMMRLFPKSLKDSRAFFYDFISKLQYMINENHSIAVTWYQSFDKFKFDTSTSYQWESNVLSAAYNGKLNDKFSLNLTGLVSNFKSDLIGETKNYESTLRSSITQQEGKANLRYQISDKSFIDVGTNYVLYKIEPGREKPTSGNSQVIERTVAAEKGREVAGYINGDISITKWLSVETGLRFVQYAYLGPKETYQYKPGAPRSRETITDTINHSSGSIADYNGLEPRLGLRIALGESTTLKLGFHRGQQFLHLVTNSTAISPVDFWKLSDQYLPQQKGDQFAAGIFRTFRGYDLSVEGYYKKQQNLLDYRNGATLLLNPVIETALVPAKGYGYGVETSVGKTSGKFSGRLNYSYSRSFIQVVTEFATEQVNHGEYYPSNADRPHNVSIQTKLLLRAGWSFNTNFVYMTGRPATYPDGNYSINNTIVTNYSVRNQDRLPDYHRLDLSISCVTRRYETQKRYSIWNFSVYNVYGRANPYSVFFKREGTALNAYRLSVIGSVIPSISWNFNF